MVVSCSFIVCDSILSCHCCPFYKVITDTCNNFLTWFSYVIRWCVVCIKDDGSVICLPIYWRARSRRTIVRSPAVDNIDPIRTSNKLRWIRFTEEHLFTRGFRNIKKKKKKEKRATVLVDRVAAKKRLLNGSFTITRADREIVDPRNCIVSRILRIPGITRSGITAKSQRDRRRGKSERPVFFHSFAKENRPWRKSSDRLYCEHVGEIEIRSFERSRSTRVLSWSFFRRIFVRSFFFLLVPDFCHSILHARFVEFCFVRLTRDFS